MKANRRHIGRAKVLLSLSMVSGFVLLALIMGADTKETKQENMQPPKTVFSKLREAENPVDLIIMPDGQKILGWIAGDESFAGKPVKITYGASTQTTKVRSDNTFVWNHDFEKRIRVAFEVGKLKRTELVEPAKPGKPAAYFVVDRTVYRPGHTLHFAAFLRKENARSQFVPLANQDVEIQLRSVGKNTVASKMQARSDKFGRVTGQYTFSPADALDNYTLTIPNYLGKAELNLAEFRKAKVRLKIDGERRGQQLTLKFQALDFLNKPVPGSKVSFTAKVFRNNKTNVQHALASDKFVYQQDSIDRLLSFDDATEDEKLLGEAGLLAAPQGHGGSHVAAVLNGSVAVSDAGRGECKLALEREWTRGAYSAMVEGVLVDYNGREQRASRLIPIGSKVVDCDLELELDKHNYTTHEPIEVRIRPLGVDGKPIKVPSTVMAMKLSPATQMQPQFGYGYGYNYGLMYNGFHLNTINNSFFGGNQSQWAVQQAAELQEARRTLVTASIAKDNKATFQIDRPGAYKLVCVAELPDGRKLKNEIGCVVRKPSQMPALILKLDRDELKSGEPLAGEIHSRFDGARVLLTVRDSTGVRWWKSLDVRNGVLRFDETLPKELRYGCLVEAQYLESQDQMHLANRFLRVEPVDRTVALEVVHNDTYEPGEEVTLDIYADRKEQVDLVVSVYDQSLLGIEKDKSTNIRDYFLADERVRNTADREIVRRRLGDITVKELVERLDKRLKQDEAFAKTQQGQHVHTAIDYYRRHNRVYAYGIIPMMNEAGIKTRAHALIHWWGWNWSWHNNKKDEITLFELLDHRRNNWQLSYRFVGDQLVLFEHHPDNMQHVMRMLRSGNVMMGGGGYGGFAGGNGFLSMNSAHSFMPVSGQSFVSHMPVAAIHSGGPQIEVLGDSTLGSQVRRDFSDSAFWNAQVRTDRHGKAKVKFKLPDSLTNWQVVVTAVTPRMHVGHAKSDFRTFKPVMIWPMIPRIFTEGDRVSLYGSVHNRTDKEQEMEVTLKVNNGKVLTQPTVKVKVPAKQNVPVYWDYQPENSGFTQLLMTTKCSAGSDASLKRLPVAAMAAEQVVTASGFARDDATITVPTEVDMDDAELEITLVPSLLDDVMQSLDYLVQYPYGCVEQTMSRFLPAIVVKQTLDRAGIENKPLEEKLPKVVEQGIKRLLELQQGDGGWGWHGGSQTHEMMTPYALYGLLRAEKAGYTIPNEHAIQRGLNRLKSFIDSMGEKQAADRIYCMYVYSHRNDLEPKHWIFIEDQLKKDQLSDYALAMSLEMAVDRKRAKLAGRLATALRRRVKQTPDAAFWTTAGFSRWGNDKFEITAAALKALAAHDSDDELIAPILSFFATTKRGNRWNSTKDTAMIVYAVCDYLATQNYKAGDQQNIALTVNDEFTSQVKLSGGLLPKIKISTKHLHHGNNKIEFDGHAPGAMFRAVFKYWQRGTDIQPMEKGLVVRRDFYLLDASGRQLREIKFGDTVPRGSYIQSVVTVENKIKQSMRYVLVENPKPATCEILPKTDSRYPQDSTAYALREDKTRGVVYHHEHTGHTIVDRCVLHAELAGNYLVPPARVELMYETLTRGHSGAFEFRVGSDGHRVSLAR